MRNYKFIRYMLCSLAVAFVGCKEEGNLAEGNYAFTLKPHYLSISPKEYSFSATQQEGTMGYVETVETPWKFSGAPEWLNISPAYGSSSEEINFKPQVNTSGDASRTSVFYLASTDPEWEYQTKLSASQDAASQFVSVSDKDSQIWFEGKSASATIKVEANCTLSASASVNWITAVLGADNRTLTISVDENSSGYDRYGYVTLSTRNGETAYIVVNQSAATLVAEESQLNFDVTAATYKLTIKSEAAWTAYASDSWISVSPTSGTSGTSEVEISVTPNTSVKSREGYVYFNIGQKRLVKVGIYQREIYIDTGESLLDIAAVGETRSLKVKSNTSWTVTSDSEWMSISPTSGSGETEATVTIADNASLSERQGYLTFVSDSKNITEKKLVRQYGKTFSVDTQLVNFSDKASSSVVEIVSDGDWKVEMVDAYDWFDISPVSTDGISGILITVKENNTTEERTGYVNVSLYDKTYQIAIHQESKYLTVNSSALNFTSKGGTSQVEIATNDAWKATVEEGNTWLATDVSEGNGECKLVVTIDDNATVESRKAYLDVISDYAGTTRLNYKQDGRYLSVDKSDFTFFAKGGTSTLTTINTDGVYKMTQDGGWFQISKVSDNAFTVTAAENKNNSERTGSITIELTDLVEGELKVVLPVVQLEKGFTFTKGDFSEDKNWNLSEGHDATITVVGFSADKSWNVNPNVSTSVQFTGYGNDKSWNKNHNSQTDVNTPGYGNDSDWNKNHNSQTDVNTPGYGNDSDWNKNHNSQTDVNNSGYGNDSDWNKKHNNNSDISGTDYGTDSNWNKQ